MSDPKQWKIVPVEATPQMVSSTWDHVVDRTGGLESQNKRNGRVYTAMLNSAPASPLIMVSREDLRRVLDGPPVLMKRSPYSSVDKQAERDYHTSKANLIHALKQEIA